MTSGLGGCAPGVRRAALSRWLGCDDNRGSGAPWGAGTKDSVRGRTRNLSRPAKGGWSGVDLNGLVDKREVVLVIGELLDEFSDAPVERRAVIARSATEETPRHPDQLG